MGLRPAANLPLSITLHLPCILISMSQRDSMGGRWQPRHHVTSSTASAGEPSTSIPKSPAQAQDPNSAPLPSPSPPSGSISQSVLTRDLITEHGSYLDVQASVGMLEHTLTIDMLNYIVVVVTLFMKEDLEERI
ncbi:unnamed protein product [Protopolystoma xenopodis]|uniref:Uncharacterized protein n=1 Tax=Protopolystoma xenopodis TaxID=117903 RepID=A0A3S5ABP5_9PLAT|nr:unnamed protein product [Protopolystoma xenopodis]